VNVEIPAAIVLGKLEIDPSHRAALQAALAQWVDGPVTITVEQPQATRSQQANRYYWGVVVKALSDHTGYAPTEMHDVMKAKFIPRIVALRRANGSVIGEYVIGGSTAVLFTWEFFEYVEHIRQWAFEDLDCGIPPPDPEWREHAEQERQEHERRHRDVSEAVRPGAADEAPRG
jgi:hypothetical protein